MNLSKKFPRRQLLSRKTSLGAGLMSPKLIEVALALKLCTRYMRSDAKVAKMIQINEDSAKVSYGHSKSMIETERRCKLRGKI